MLRVMPITAGPIATCKVKVLFLCTGNACRSQMSEAWARQLAGDYMEAYSAGVAPHGIDLRAVQVMSEVGVDMSAQKSKHVDELSGVPFDYVITACDNAAESCPMFLGAARKIHRSFQDPPRLALSASSEAEALTHYRRVRDEIRDFIYTLRDTLAVT